MTYILICIFFLNGQPASGFSAEFNSSGDCAAAKQRIKSEAPKTIAFCAPRGR